MKASKAIGEALTIRRNQTIEEIKKRTKCNRCNKIGHWARECKAQGSRYNQQHSNNDVVLMLSTILTTHASTNQSNQWVVD